MTELRAEEMWDTYLQTPNAKRLPQEILRDLRGYMVEIPTELKEFLDLPVTYINLSTARIKFTLHMIDTGLWNAIKPAREILNMIPGLTTRAPRDFRSSVRSYFDDLVLNLTAKSIEEKTLVLGLGLSFDLLPDLRKGTLTIAELLRRQPSVFIDLVILG